MINESAAVDAIVELEAAPPVEVVPPAEIVEYVTPPDWSKFCGNDIVMLFVTDTAFAVPLTFNP